MLIRSKRRFCIACLLYLTFAPQTLLAETESWHYKLTPYLWNVSFDGNTSSGGNGIPIDTDYSFFTLDNLDNVFSIAFEANNGHCGILLDGLRARYSDTASNRISIHNFLSSLALSRAQ